jgi:hypothetical protein
LETNNTDVCTKYGEKILQSEADVTSDPGNAGVNWALLVPYFIYYSSQNKGYDYGEEF